MSEGKKKEERVESEYEKETKVKLLQIFEYLENDEYLKAVDAISEIVGDGSLLDPLKEKLQQKKEIFDIMTEIMKKSGRYLFKRQRNYGDPKPDPTTLLYHHLQKDEKMWYRISFKDDYSREAPKKDFETLFDLINRYQSTLGRKKIIQMYFFGEYFGVNDISNEQISRTGLGLAMERGRRFTLSGNFHQNKPSTDHLILCYVDGRLRFIDKHKNLFQIQKKTVIDSKEDDDDDEEEEEEEGEEDDSDDDDFENPPKPPIEPITPKKQSTIKIINDISMTPYDMSQETLESLYESVTSIGGGGNCYFPNFNRYDDEYEYDGEEEDVSKLVDDTHLLNKEIPDHLLHFFSFDSESSSNIGHILQYMIENRRIETLKKIFTNFPETIVSYVSEEEHHSDESTPIFFTVLRTKDKALIDKFINNGFGEEASNILKKKLPRMKYSWYGSGNSTRIPLVHQILKIYSSNISKFEDTYVSNEELGVDYVMMHKIQKAIQSSNKSGANNSSDSDDSDDDEESEEEEEEDKKKNFEEKKKMYIELKKRKYEEKHKKEVEASKRNNEMMKWIFGELKHYIDWTAQEKRGGRYGSDSRNSFIEKVIMNDNLDIAKFVIRKLMVDREGEKPIKNKLNYFHLDDLKITGEKAVGNSRNRRRRKVKRRSRRNAKTSSSANVNSTYEYVLSMRTFWNPSNFKFFSREYQHIVCLFVWSLEERGWYLPPEMICQIFQFVDFFAFGYILGRVQGGSGIFVWDGPLPDFARVNMKSYYHEVLTIKEAGRKCFYDTRGAVGELEFKGMLEYCLQNIETFFTYISDQKKEDEENTEKMEELGSGGGRVKGRTFSKFRGTEHERTHHHGLITFVHHLKKELYYLFQKNNNTDSDNNNNNNKKIIKKIVKVMKKQYKEEVKIVEDRIEYEKKNQYASRWRRPAPQIDWLNVSGGGGSTKYYSVPEKKILKSTPTPEVGVKKFLKFVKKLR